MSDVKKLCSVAQCGSPSRTRGLCKKHYQRLLKKGSVELRPRRGGPQDYLHNIVIPYDGDECLKWPFARGKTGYGYVNYNRRTMLASRAVCIAVNGPPPQSDSQAAHSCGNGVLGCVNPKHIRWASPKENQADRVIHGTDGRGERNSNAKLNKAAVLRIRSQLRSGKTQSQIADEFCISHTTVSCIELGKRWGHV